MSEQLRSQIELLFKATLLNKLQDITNLAKADPQPNMKIRQVADQYAAQHGLKLNHNIHPVKVNRQRAEKIAQAYHDMKHDPQNPAVKSAYDAFIRETSDQLAHIKNTGLKIEKMPPGMDNPYKNGSQDLFNDINTNNHMWYFPTESAYGTGDTPSDHPMLQPTAHLDDEGKPMLANDMFRVVHDYFGHSKEGLSFGPKGEENAWRHHMDMYSPEAQKALTSEARGQNSWTNFGPHGEHNRANPHLTRYPEQKAGLLPEHAYETGANDALEDDVKKSEVLMKAPFQYDYEQNPKHATHDYKVFNDRNEYNLVHNVKLPNGLQYRQYQHKRALPTKNRMVHTIFHPGYDTDVAMLETANEGPEYHGAGKTIPNVVQWSEVHPLWRGKGLGKQAYLAALLHGKGMEQGMSSDTRVSPAAHKVWLSFRGIPGLKGIVGRYAKDPGEESQRHKVYVADASKPQHNSIFHGHFSDYMPKTERLAASETSIENRLKRLYERRPDLAQKKEEIAKYADFENIEKDASSTCLMWPVSINGEEKDPATGDRYHITLRHLGQQPVGPEFLNQFFADKGHMVPEGYSLEPQMFNTPKGNWHVLQLKQHPQWMQDMHESLDQHLGPDKHISYIPHMSVPKHMYDRFIADPKSLELHVKPLEMWRNNETLWQAPQRLAASEADLEKGLKEAIMAGAITAGSLLGAPAHADYTHVHNYLNAMKGKIPGVQVESNVVPGAQHGKISVGKFHIKTAAVLGGKSGISDHRIGLYGPFKPEEQEHWSSQDLDDYTKVKQIHDHLKHNMPELMDMTQHHTSPTHKSEEDLAKSKNVREQRAEVFGTKDAPTAGSKMAEKHMKHISKFAKDYLGLKIKPSGGKIDPKTGKRRDEAPEKGVDKPDWRSGNLESQWNPNAMVHELAHLMLLPKGVGLKEGQQLMDKQYADVQRQFGYMKQKRSVHEVQPMAAENLIRRIIGLPANQNFVPVASEEEPPRTMVEDPSVVIGTRVKKGKKNKLVDLIRQSRFLTPENRQRIEDVISKKLVFHPQHGWMDNPEHAVARQAEERRQKAMFGDTIRFKDDEKLAASEVDDLEKMGMRGDWKKEKYRIVNNKKDDYGVFTVSALHGKKVVGQAFIRDLGTHLEPYSPDPAMEAIDIDPEHRRKGLATAMYQHAEKVTGNKMRPDTVQSADAQALWAQPNRPFGGSDE